MEVSMRKGLSTSEISSALSASLINTLLKLGESRRDDGLKALERFARPAFCRAVQSRKNQMRT